MKVAEDAPVRKRCACRDDGGDHKVAKSGSSRNGSSSKPLSLFLGWYGGVS